MPGVGVGVVDGHREEAPRGPEVALDTMRGGVQSHREIGRARLRPVSTWSELRARGRSTGMLAATSGQICPCCAEATKANLHRAHRFTRCQSL